MVGRCQESSKITINSWGGDRIVVGEQYKPRFLRERIAKRRMGQSIGTRGGGRHTAARDKE